MLIRLFRRVKTLLITSSNNIVETHLKTIEIKKSTGFLISIFFCRVKTLLITTSNKIVETRLQTIEIKNPLVFLFQFA